MGSCFSVYNDTDKPIWVSVGVCKAALFGSIAGVLAVVTAGASVAGGIAAGGTTAATFAIEGAEIVEAGTAVMGTCCTLTAGQWQALGTVSGLLASGSGITSGLCGNHHAKVSSARKQLEEKLKSYTEVPPGSKFTKWGSMSLVLTAYVVYDDFKEATHDCWTSPGFGW